MLTPPPNGRPSDGEHDARFVGDETDDLRYRLEQIDKQYNFAQIRSWTILHEGLTATARSLYSLLRSMLNESKTRGLRRMTVDQICWLLPGINGKPTSATRVRDAIGLLLTEGLLEDVDAEKGLHPSQPRLYRVKDLPPDGYTGWRNAWDKLDAYTPDWRTNRPEPAGQDGATDFRTPSADPHGNPKGGLRKNAGGPRISVGGLRKNGATRGVTCENGSTQEEGSKKKSKESSSSEDACAPARDGASAGWRPDGREEEESAYASNPVPAETGSRLPEPAVAGKTVQEDEPSREARLVTASLNGVPRTAVLEVASEVDAALERGWAPDDVVERLRATNWVVIRGPRRFVAGKLSGRPSAVGRLIPVRELSLEDARQRGCPDCAMVPGWRDGPKGDATVRCDHWRLLNCPDCEGRGVLGGGSKCRHENAPERLSGAA